jgi:hypothetical protein
MRITLMADHPRAARLPARLVVPVSLFSILAGGCDRGLIRPRAKPIPPRDARQALERINANLEKIDGALYCPGLTSFRFRDASGGDRRFIGHKATLIFEAPRALYFDIKHSLGGSVARIASNDEQYWLWIDTPETRKLWHGHWDVLAAGGARSLAVPPGQLLDALMLRPLPTWLDGALKPLLRIDGSDQRLLFIGLDQDGWTYVKRELLLDPQPPYMPREITDRNSAGQVVMHAYLRKYRPVRDTGPDGPWTARSYVVYWELDRSEMRLDLSDVRYRTKDTPFCDFPDSWDGDVESLDEAPTGDLAGQPSESVSHP